MTKKLNEAGDQKGAVAGEIATFIMQRGIGRVTPSDLRGHFRLTLTAAQAILDKTSRTFAAGGNGQYTRAMQQIGAVTRKSNAFESTETPQLSITRGLLERRLSGGHGSKKAAARKGDPLKTATSASGSMGAGKVAEDPTDEVAKGGELAGRRSGRQGKKPAAKAATRADATGIAEGVLGLSHKRDPVTRPGVEQLHESKPLGEGTKDFGVADTKTNRIVFKGTEAKANKELAKRRGPAPKLGWEPGEGGFTLIQTKKKGVGDVWSESIEEANDDKTDDLSAKKEAGLKAKAKEMGATTVTGKGPSVNATFKDRKKAQAFLKHAKTVGKAAMRRSGDTEFTVHIDEDDVVEVIAISGCTPAEARVGLEVSNEWDIKENGGRVEYQHPDHGVFEDASQVVHLISKEITARLRAHGLAESEDSAVVQAASHLLSEGAARALPEGCVAIGDGRVYFDGEIHESLEAVQESMLDEALITVRVIPSSGEKDAWTTSIQGPFAKAKAYFMGNQFNIGTGGKDKMVTIEKVELIEDWEGTVPETMDEAKSEKAMMARMHTRIAAGLAPKLTTGQLKPTSMQWGVGSKAYAADFEVWYKNARRGDNSKPSSRDFGISPLAAGKAEDSVKKKYPVGTGSKGNKISRRRMGEGLIEAVGDDYPAFVSACRASNRHAVLTGVPCAVYENENGSRLIQSDGVSGGLPSGYEWTKVHQSTVVTEAVGGGADAVSVEVTDIFDKGETQHPRYTVNVVTNHRDSYHFGMFEMGTEPAGRHTHHKWPSLTNPLKGAARRGAHMKPIALKSLPAPLQKQLSSLMKDARAWADELEFDESVVNLEEYERWAPGLREEVLVIGSGGLRKQTGIKIFPNSVYYIGASTSPSMILVTDVSGDRYTYASYPYNQTRTGSLRYDMGLIADGTVMHAKQYAAYTDAKQKDTWKKNLKGEKGPLNGKQKLKDYQYILVTCVANAKTRDLYGQTKNYGVLMDYWEASRPQAIDGKETSVIKVQRINVAQMKKDSFDVVKVGRKVVESEQDFDDWIEENGLSEMTSGAVPSMSVIHPWIGAYQSEMSLVLGQPDDLDDDLEEGTYLDANGNVETIEEGSIRLERKPSSVAKEVMFVVMQDDEPIGFIRKFKDTRTDKNPWQAMRYKGKFKGDGKDQYDFLGSTFVTGKAGTRVATNAVVTGKRLVEAAPESYVKAVRETAAYLFEEAYNDCENAKAAGNTHVVLSGPAQRPTYCPSEEEANNLASATSGAQVMTIGEFEEVLAAMESVTGFEPTQIEEAATKPAQTALKEDVDEGTKSANLHDQVVGLFAGNQGTAYKAEDVSRLFTVSKAEALKVLSRLVAEGIVSFKRSEGYSIKSAGIKMAGSKQHRPGSNLQKIASRISKRRTYEDETEETTTSGGVGGFSQQPIGGYPEQKGRTGGIRDDGKHIKGAVSNFSPGAIGKLVKQMRESMPQHADEPDSFFIGLLGETSERTMKEVVVYPETADGPWIVADPYGNEVEHQTKEAAVAAGQAMAESEQWGFVMTTGKIASESDMTDEEADDALDEMMGLYRPSKAELAKLPSLKIGKSTMFISDVSRQGSGKNSYITAMMYGANGGSKILHVYPDGRYSVGPFGGLGNLKWGETKDIPKLKAVLSGSRIKMESVDEFGDFMSKGSIALPPKLVATLSRMAKGKGEADFLKAVSTKYGAELAAGAKKAGWHATLSESVDEASSKAADNKRPVQLGPIERELLKTLRKERGKHGIEELIAMNRALQPLPYEAVLAAAENLSALGLVGGNGRGIMAPFGESVWGRYEQYLFEGGGLDEAEVEFYDRYSACGMDLPDPKTMCKGQCEGMGCVPTGPPEGYVKEGKLCCPSDNEEPWRTLWLEAEEKEPSEDGWHFVTCPDCNGSGKADEDNSDAKHGVARRAAKSATADAAEEATGDVASLPSVSSYKVPSSHPDSDAIKKAIVRAKTLAKKRNEAHVVARVEGEGVVVWAASKVQAQVSRRTRVSSKLLVRADVSEASTEETEAIKFPASLLETYVLAAQAAGLDDDPRFIYEAGEFTAEVPVAVAPRIRELVGAAR